MADSPQNKANDGAGKRGTSDGYMKKGKALEWGKMSPEQKKAWVKNDKTVAPVKKIAVPPYPMEGGTFTQQLEKHKEIGASLDNGRWKPRFPGQTFNHAIDEHSANRAGKFR